MKVFHGTKAPEKILAEGFDMEVRRHDPGDLGWGIYLTDLRARARTYGTIVEVEIDATRYAKIPNPYFLDGLTATEPTTAPGRLFYGLAFPDGADAHMATVKGSWEDRVAAAKAIRSAFLAAGYAGIIAGPDSIDQREVVVFDLSTVLAPRKPQEALQDHRSPCERTRDALEAAGYPDGVDYEALILAEDEENADGW